MDGDKLTRPMNAGAVKKYCQNIQKNQSNQKTKKIKKNSISRKPEKAT